MNPFSGQIAIVTGAANGIGRALAHQLADRGAVVIATDMDGPGAAGVADAIREAGGIASSACVDVCDADAVEAMVAQTVSEHGRIDYLFNNAGKLIAGEVRDISLEQWREIMDTNVMGVVHGVSAAYPQMVRQGNGHIINVGSVAGLVSFPTAAPYVASKHAVVGFSTALRVEAAGLGVKVSVACPGFVDTPLYETATVVNAKREEVFSQIPFKRMHADKAALAILRGVVKNKKIICFPFHGRFAWFARRFFPFILAAPHRQLLKGFREVRHAPDVPPSG